MANFDSVIGHEVAKTLLNSAIKNNRISHAYLFIGPANLGKFKLAVEFAKIIRCQDGPNNRGAKIENGTDPDVLIIDPNKGGNDSTEKASVITIKEIRSLEHYLSLFPYNSKYKIAVINGAHKFTDEAVNAFLKTLEEPRGNSIIILIAESRHFLPQTLVSRVQIIRFWPARIEVIEKSLISFGFNRDKARQIALASRGKPGLAFEMAKDAETLAAYAAEAEEFNNFLEGNLENRFLFAEKMAKNEGKILDTLRFWLELAREKLLAKYMDKKETGNKIYISPERLLKFIHGLNLIINLIATSNVNKKLAMENLALEI